MTTTLSTAVLDRLTAEEGTKYTLSVTPVSATCPTGIPYGAEMGWFVTAVGHGSALTTAEHTESFPNTIRRVLHDGAGARPRYQTGDSHTYIRLSGALVNPAPVNGRHYALLETSGGEESYVVRYNDDEHVADRHRPGLPFSIVSGKGGAAWMFSRDALAEQTLDDWVYIEVEPVTAGEPAVSEAGEPAREQVNGSFDGPTLGLAEVDGDGHVEVDPEPVEGKFYVHWEASERTVTLAQRVNGEWRSVGYYTRITNGGDPTGDLRYTNSSSIVLNEGTRWALARLETPAEPEGVDLGERRSRLMTTLQAEVERWQRLDEALLDLARDKDWCSEFEAFGEPLGFSARERTGNWVVRVTARISATIDSPASDVDSRVESAYDLPGLSMTSMTIEGTVAVRIPISDETEDGARDYVDSSVILDAMDSSTEVEIIDWEIDSVDAD
ncbi:hypothetical protein PBI_BEAGLE_101 [Arthrobacter phage Beagle]|nr:hypothetical protein PBI_BEAGLE_101 [Arthrobacter phage Beagle]